MSSSTTRSTVLRTRRAKLSVLAASTIMIGGASIAVNQTAANARTVIGTAELKLASGEKVGTVTFENPKDGDATIIKVDMAFPANSIATETFHGLHIHANDVATNGAGCVADPKAASNTWFVAVDGHYKKDAAQIHGGHSGDLATVFINRDRTAHIETRIDRFVASELTDRAVIFHADPDNYGNIPKGTALTQYTPNGAEATTATANTGNAGDRVACGMIEVK
jgi:superoxide dismutase, Cu-Zn family